ncbi:MAG TPA: hypothetical protein VF861_14495 [Telluria sp.]
MNLRIVSDNAADRAAVAASTTAGGYVAANLLVDLKSNWHRATGTSVTYTVTWSAAETISCVAIPYCNLSPTATMRVRLYAADGVSVVYDSTAVSACPAPALRPRGWTAAQAASAYANGGGACARHWFAPRSAFKLVLDLVDVNNLQGYIEAARLVVGAYWSPAYNDFGASVTNVDSTTHYRTGAGDLVSDAGTVHRRVPVELSRMAAADRAKMAAILRDSRAYPIFLSLLPGVADFDLERDYTVYGKRTRDSDVTMQFALAYSTSIEIEEI